MGSTVTIEEFYYLDRPGSEDSLKSNIWIDQGWGRSNIWMDQNQGSSSLDRPESGKI